MQYNMRAEGVIKTPIQQAYIVRAHVSTFTDLSSLRKWAGRTVSDQPDQSSSSDRLKNLKTMQSIKMINLKLTIKVMHNICASHGARVKFD